MKKIGAFVVYSLSFNLADLNWPKVQSTSFRYLLSRDASEMFTLNWFRMDILKKRDISTKLFLLYHMLGAQ